MAINGTIQGKTKNSSGADNTSKYATWMYWQRNGDYDINNNKSNITVYIRVQRVDGYTGTTAWNKEKKPTVNLKVGGVAKTPTIDYIDTRNKVVCTFATWTGDVYHNNDGTLNLALSCDWSIGMTSLYSGSISGTATLDTIPRKATVSKVTGFTDEGNPTVTFSNPANFNLVPYFNVYKDGVKVYSIQRTRGKYTSPYTFSLTDAERTAMRNACNAKNEYEVWIGVETYNGTTLLDYSSLGEKLTIVNANPTFDASLISFKDTNSTVVGITGNNQTIVQNKSTLSVTCGAATGVKGATISKYEVTLNGVTKTITTANGGTVSMGAVAKDGNLKISVKVIDSRGNPVTKEKDITIVPYSKPILAAHSSYGHIVCERCDEDGVIDKSGKYLKLIIKGKWYSLINGENNATVDVQITSKNYESSWINVPATVLGGGSANGYQSWVDINTKVDGVTFELTKAYVVTVRCIDEFGNASDETTYTDLSYKIPTDSVALHLGKGGNKAAFGKYAEYDKVLELAEDWDLMMKGQTVRDFIVEQGTSGIWTYIKRASGKAECWGKYSSTVPSSAWTSWGNCYYAPILAKETVSFPFEFTEVPKVYKDFGNVSGSIVLIDGWNSTTTKAKMGDVYGLRPVAPTSSCYADLILYVVGKWK